MIDVEDLIALVRNYNPGTNAELIRKAYDYGFRMHAGQTRHSGEPYFTHPVSVAAILSSGWMMRRSSRRCCMTRSRTRNPLTPRSRANSEKKSPNWWMASPS